MIISLHYAYRVKKQMHRVSQKNDTPLHYSRSHYDVTMAQFGDLPWHVKHAPQHIRDFVGNRDAVRELQSWLSTFHSQKKRCTSARFASCLLMSGPIGVGKSLLVTLLAKHFRCELITLNAASRPDKRMFLQRIHEVLHPMQGLQHHATTTSQFRRRRPQILLIEEINAIVSSGKGSDELKTLLHTLKDARQPLICITDQRDEEGIQRLIKVSRRVRLSVPSSEEIGTFLMRVLQREKVTGVTKALCRTIATQTHGDLRKALFQLQLQHHDDDDHHHHQKTTMDSMTERPSSDATLTYMTYFDTYGTSSLYHVLEHYAIPAFDPTHNQACHFVANALLVANQLQHLLTNTYADQDEGGLSMMAPYLSYFSVGVAFALAPNTIVRNRVDIPSHASTCKRYLSSLRTLMDRTRTAIFYHAPKAPSSSVFMNTVSHFSEYVLSRVKQMLSEPVLVYQDTGLMYVVSRALTYRFTHKDLDFIFKCGTFSHQPRITRYISKRMRSKLNQELKRVLK